MMDLSSVEQITATAPGTGDFVFAPLSGTSRQTFLAALGVGGVCVYMAEAGSQWECREGMVGSDGRLLREPVILDSSAAGAAVNFTAPTRVYIPAGWATAPDGPLLVTAGLAMTQRHPLEFLCMMTSPGQAVLLPPAGTWPDGTELTLHSVQGYSFAVKLSDGTMVAPQVDAGMVLVALALPDGWFCRLVGGSAWPVGGLAWFAADEVPVCWVPATGRTIPRTSLLGAALVAGSCPWGSGNGTSTVHLPNFQCRVLVGQDRSSAGLVTAAGSGVDATRLGATGGSEFLQTHTHTPGKVGSATTFSGIIPLDGNVRSVLATGYPTPTPVGSTGVGASQNVQLTKILWPCIFAGEEVTL